MKNKFDNLKLMDLEVAKTILLCKWIVNAIEPGESNLQFMLRYRLACFNPRRGRNWGPSLDWLHISNTKDSLGLRFGGALIKHGRLWLKAPTNFHPPPTAPSWNCSTQKFSGVHNLNLLPIGSPLVGLMNSTIGYPIP